MLIKGFILGFGIAAPVGPIGILCIHKTLSEGMKNGILCGLGAAMADMLYGSIAAFGLTSISNLLVSKQQVIRVIGSLFLSYLAFKIFFSSSKKEEIHSHRGSTSNFLSTFFLTLTNPMTILAFVTIFAGMGVVQTKVNYLDACSLIIGVFLGSMSWWIILALLVNAFRLRLLEKLYIINRLSGAFILSFAVFMLAEVYA